MSGGVHVLVVDDHEAMRSSVADILRAAGYVVSEAADVDSALAIASSTRVAVIVLDLHLPDADGTALLDALEVRPKVVLMSGQPLAGDAAISRDPRIYMVVRKPFRPQLLLDAVAGAVGLGVEN